MPTTNPKITVLRDISSTSIDLPRPPALPPWKRTTDPNSSTSEIFTRINTFLPELRAANAQLESEIVQGRISERRIEDVGEDEEQYIEMNLGLGVLEEKKKQAPTSKRRKMDTEVLMKQVDSEDEDDHGRTGGSDGDGREEQEGSGSSGSDEETSDEGSAEEGDDDDDDDDDECDSNSSTSSTSHTDSSAHYPQQQDEQDNESARIYALLSVLGVESTEYPQPLDGKWKRRHEERKDAQRDILAALLNIDTPPGSTGSGGSGGKGGAKRKPVIEVVEVEGKE